MKIAIIFDAFPKGGGGFYQSLQSSLFLKKIENLYGEDARRNIEEMTKITLKREILGDTL